jgi:hypothetical protein
MELVLKRICHPEGSNGGLYNGAQLVCRTIELPWRDNEPRVSCIPEGRYELLKRYSKKYQWHLLVKGVPGRSYILIHPANVALTELKGCIAPVSAHTGPGRGSQSRIAQAKLHGLVFPALERSEIVYLTIQS